MRSVRRWSGLLCAIAVVVIAGCSGSAPTMGEAPQRELQDYTQQLVSDAVDHFDEHGLDATIERYNDPGRVDGPWYVFVLEDRDGALYTVANPARPELVGTTRDRIDPTGYDYGEAFAAVTEGSGGAWVSYVFTHPVTGADAPKHSWVVRRGDVLIGAGWYE